MLSCVWIMNKKIIFYSFKFSPAFSLVLCQMTRTKKYAGKSNQKKLFKSFDCLLALCDNLFKSML